MATSRSKGKPTGNTRYRVASLGLFRRKQVLVLQYEMAGKLTEYYGGWVDHYAVTWWEDAKPEWVMVENND